MEVIIVITKEVLDDAEALIITNKLKDVLSADPVLSDTRVRIQSETKAKIETKF